MGKSKLLQTLIACRIAQTIIQATTITEKSLVTDSSRFFNHKTLVFEEAPEWLLGVNSDGRHFKVQSGILKDVLARSASLAMRNYWDGDKGTSEVCISAATMMINILLATNVGYPPKDSPLMRRMMVDDVVYAKLNTFGVRDIAWVLDHQKDKELEELVRYDHMARQAMHVIVELFIMSLAMDDVNVDIPVLLMPGVFEYLKKHYDVPYPDIRMMGMILKGCRVEAIQHAIRVAYFSEIGQLKHQFVLEDIPHDKGKERSDGVETNPVASTIGAKRIKLDDSGRPKKRGLDISTIPDEIEPLLFCTEDTFAYVMTMLKSHVVPCVVGEVKNALSKLVLQHRPGLKEMKMKRVSGMYWYETYDTNYYQMLYTSKEKFFTDVATHTGDRINGVTAKTVISEICQQPMFVTRLSPVMRRADFDLPSGGPTNDKNGGGIGDEEEGASSTVTRVDLSTNKYEIMYPDMEIARMREKSSEEKRSKHGKMLFTPIKFEKPRDRNGVTVCIARCLVEHEIPSHIPIVNDSTGDIVRGPAKIINYDAAMQEALTYAMSHYATRERRIVISDDLMVGSKPYPELLAYIDVKRNKKRVLMKRHHLAPQSARDLLLGYAESSKQRTKGFSAPVQIADQDLEYVVAKNHARNIGREFNDFALPWVQEQLISDIRAELPDIFDNPTVEYPEEMRLLIDTDNAGADVIMNTINAAAKEGTLEELLQDPRFKQYTLGHAGEAESFDDESDIIDPSKLERDASVVVEAIGKAHIDMQREMSVVNESPVTSMGIMDEIRKMGKKLTADDMDKIYNETADSIFRRDETLQNLRNSKPYKDYTFETPQQRAVQGINVVERDTDTELRGDRFRATQRARTRIPQVAQNSTQDRANISVANMSTRARNLKKTRSRVSRRLRHMREFMKPMHDEILEESRMSSSNREESYSCSSSQAEEGSSSLPADESTVIGHIMDAAASSHVPHQYISSLMNGEDTRMSASINSDDIDINITDDDDDDDISSRGVALFGAAATAEKENKQKASENERELLCGDDTQASIGLSGSGGDIPHRQDAHSKRPHSQGEDSSLSLSLRQEEDMLDLENAMSEVHVVEQESFDMFSDL